MADKLKTISIKGKQYVQVNERVKAFRSTKEWQGWSIETNVHTLTDDVCVMCARIKDDAGRVIATGWAREVRNDSTSMVNKTSYVENCETSAVGRALGYLGIGVDDNICSVEELVHKIQAEQNSAPAAPVTSKGGAIYPAKDKTQESANKQPMAGSQSLFEDEGEAFNELLADIESVETCDNLVALMNSSRVQDSPYREALRRAGYNLMERKGWKYGKQQTTNAL